MSSELSAVCLNKHILVRLSPLPEKPENDQAFQAFSEGNADSLRGVVVAADSETVFAGDVIFFEPFCYTRVRGPEDLLCISESSVQVAIRRSPPGKDE